MKATTSLRRFSKIVFVSTALFVCTSIGQNAAAQGTTGTMFSDLWWNPSESGWGVTVEHSESFMFLTFFVQKSDGSPYWVTASLNRTTPGNGITFPISYSGNVFETHGTYFGSPWNPANVANRMVGAATFTATSIGGVTLMYSVDGVPVTKSLVRQTLLPLNFRGTYLGGILYQTFNCNPSSLNGQTISEGGYLTITQNGSAILISSQGPTSGSCAFNGTYSQFGQIGQTGGTFVCADGTNGPFSLLAMQWTTVGFTGYLTGTANLAGQSCSITGEIGGITGNHFLP